MKLDGWLRKDPSVVERLQVVEGLAQAVNAAHERGQLLAGLEPSRVEVSGDGGCDLGDALRGSPAAAYRAPEREGDAPATTASDVYAAGAIVWETLVGRAYASGPSHLSEARTDLPGDLADAVMACLEGSPEWRPKDLGYVAQLAHDAAVQRGGSRPAAPKHSAPRSERGKRTAAPPRPSLETRGSGESRSHTTLLIAVVLVLAAAAGGYFWMTRGGGATVTATAPVSPPALPGAAAAPGATPEPAAPTATPTPAATPTAAATPETPPATPEPTPTPVDVPVARVPATRPPAPEPAALAQPTNSVPASAPATAAPAPAAAAPTDAAPEPAPAAPRERAELSTLSPLSVKRPGRVLFDLRGSGLASDLQARLVAVRDAPKGLSVVRQKCSGTLCNVLVELDGSVKPAVYAIVLEDPQGRQTNALTFTVTR